MVIQINYSFSVNFWQLISLMSKFRPSPTRVQLIEAMNKTNCTEKLITLVFMKEKRLTIFIILW